MFTSSEKKRYIVKIQECGLQSRCPDLLLGRTWPPLPYTLAVCQLQHMLKQGVELIRNESEGRRNMRLKDMPQQKQRNMWLKNKRQRKLQAKRRV